MGGREGITAALHRFVGRLFKGSFFLRPLLRFQHLIDLIIDDFVAGNGQPSTTLHSYQLRATSTEDEVEGTIGMRSYVKFSEGAG